MNIWDELSAIGESAPPGTWDNVPTNLSTMGETSTPDSVLLSQLMDSNLAKNEREWFAAREIKRLTVENEALRAEIERLTAVITYLRQGGGVAIHGTGGIGRETGASGQVESAAVNPAEWRCGGGGSGDNSKTQDIKIPGPGGGGGSEYPPRGGGGGAGIGYTPRGASGGPEYANPLLAPAKPPEKQE